MEGPTFEAQSTRDVYVIYDKDNGNIVHTHEYVGLVDAEQPSTAEIETEALNLASRATGKAISQMAALPVRKEDLAVGVEYEIDLREERLVAKGPHTS